MSAPSVDSASGASATPGQVRRRRILGALDIDLWQVRGRAPERSLAPPVESGAAASRGPGSPASRGAGPAAARALLADSLGESTATPPPRTPDPAAVRAAPEASKRRSGQRDDTSVAPVEPLDLLCLSAPEGVLLAQHAAMTPMLSRLLNDVLRAAVLVRSGGTGSGRLQKIKPQSLRFAWPPTDPGQRLDVIPDTAAVNRALRGFLNRQFEGKTDGVLLLASAGLRERLADIELALPAERVCYIGEPETLLGDGAAKRALWQTLKAL